MQWKKNQTGGDNNWVEQIRRQQTQTMATDNGNSSQNRTVFGLHEQKHNMEHNGNIQQHKSGHKIGKQITNRGNEQGQQIKANNRGKQ